MFSTVSLEAYKRIVLKNFQHTKLFFYYLASGLCS